MNNENRNWFLFGVLAGFFAGANLALAVALTYGQAWSNWK